MRRLLGAAILLEGMGLFGESAYLFWHRIDPSVGVMVMTAAYLTTVFALLLLAGKLR